MKITIEIKPASESQRKKASEMLLLLGNNMKWLFELTNKKNKVIIDFEE